MTTFTTDNCYGNIHINNGEVKIEGVVTGPCISKRIGYYWAGNPAPKSYAQNDENVIYPNLEIAFDNSPNMGCMPIDENNKFSFTISMPAPHYIKHETELLEPYVNIKICDNAYETIKLV